MSRRRWGWLAIAAGVALFLVGLLPLVLNPHESQSLAETIRMRFTAFFGFLLLVAALSFLVGAWLLGPRQEDEPIVVDQSKMGPG